MKQFDIDVIIIEPGLIKMAISGITEQHVANYEASEGYNNMSNLAVDVFSGMLKYGSSTDVIANVF